MRRLGIQEKGEHRVSHASSGCRKASFSSTSVASSSDGSAVLNLVDFGSQDSNIVSEASSGTNALLWGDLANREKFRIAFLRKLSYEKVWVPKAHRPQSHQSVIIFDWDDTLLCTSYLTAVLQFMPSARIVEEALRSISKAVQQLLETSLRFGRTFIITNARSTWVEYSAARYVPDVLPTLEKVEVISARGRHEAEFPGEIGKWKHQAFLDVQRRMDSDIITNLISVGDSNFEMDAAHSMGNQFSEALVKTIKFYEKPHPHELLTQLEVLSTKFEAIFGMSKDLKLGFERK